MHQTAILTYVLKSQASLVRLDFGLNDKTKKDLRGVIIAIHTVTEMIDWLVF